MELLVGNPERTRPLRIPRHTWEDNITMDLGELQCEGVDGIHLVQGRKQLPAVVNRVMKLLSSVFYYLSD
jgi:hypothetical protein